MGAPTKTVNDYLKDANELLRKKNAEIVNLKKTVDQLRRENDTADAIRAELYSLAAYRPCAPEWTSARSRHSGTLGTPITIWSDFHYGEVVSREELNGINEYNQRIAKTRFKRLVDRTVELAEDHMGGKKDYPGIIACLGGDMIGGDIHEELLATNDRTPHQAVNDLTDLLAGGIEHLATKFGRVYCPSVVGNHGRASRKPRMKGRVFTNYDWSIYCNLERHFRKERHITIDVPNTPDAHFKSYGRRFMLTHGDDLGVKGGDGIIGAIGPIMRGTMKIGAQQAKIGLDFDHLIICHWHQPLWLPRVTVNNAFKGPDEYAMLRLRAEPNPASQLLWFNHPEYGTTARWEVFLENKATVSDPLRTEWVSWPNTNVR